MKVCLFGLSEVGKTSLVHRVVHGLWGDRYLRTLGVRVDKTDITLDSGEVLTVMLWDIDGQQEQVRPGFVSGASGYLLVADGTRRETVEAACALQARIEQVAGRAMPFQLLLNKADLEERWEIDAALLTGLEQRGWSVRCTSAKTGMAVEAAFSQLAKDMLVAPPSLGRCVRRPAMP